MGKKITKAKEEVETEEIETPVEEVLPHPSEFITIPAPKLPTRMAVLEGRQKTFVTCPDGCEYDLDDVPDQFKHLL